MKRIPKGFQMGPHRISVMLVSEAEMRDVVNKSDTPLGPRELAPKGLTVFETNEIYVQRCTRSFSKQNQLHTFWHEYFHMLFWCVGRERLSRDETLVDNCGAMQLQAIQSAEF
jgi:hypothetical protein